MMSSLSARLHWIALGSSLFALAGCGGEEEQPKVNGLAELSILAPAEVQVGAPVAVLVMAKGTLSSPFSRYRGTLQLDSSDAQATVTPASYTFSEADAGSHAFTVVFKTAGTQTVHLVDKASSAESSKPVRVTAAAPAKIVIVSGDGQRGAGGKALPAPLVAKVTDAFGNGLGGKALTWAVASGGGALAPAGDATGADGTASATATLGAGPQANAFTASADGLPSVTFSATRNAYRLAYTDPTTGIVRLVRNAAASTETTVVLDLVAVAAPALPVYAAGFNLPLDVTRATLDPAKPFVLPEKLALDPGSAPKAAMASLPSSGPLANHLVTVLSQKATGAGAVATDTAITAGAVLYSIRLTLQPEGAPGVVFDGATPIKSGGLLNKAGAAVVSPKDVGIGRLEVVE